MESSQTVIFTKRAFNAIVTETISKHPIETGGIFLGYLLDNGTWIVVENISPGYKSTHCSAYFEYDTEFVTYLANVVANQYKGNLQILGLWHRHPGSLDVFSSTDDQTNRNYASDNPLGAISALVNCDPQMRITMYHVSQNGEYCQAEWYVDDGDLIPQELFELHYTDADELPVFDKKGVVSISERRSTLSLAEQQQEIYEGTVVNSEPIAQFNNRKPYNVADAMKDFQQIVKQLMKGTADED